MAGLRVGKLTVIERGASFNGHAHWVCKCDCGNTKTCSGVALRKAIKAKAMSSCGCYHPHRDGKTEAPQL